eukprot:Skav211679  [mRNA]  locus=scaffold216:334003:337590:- [translate_table: standard]
MTGAARADQWLAAAAAAPKKLHRPDAVDGTTQVVSVEIQQQVYTDMARTADENLFHPDTDKLFAANQGLADKLRGMIQVQNWLIDMFLHVLPTEAAARPEDVDILLYSDLADHDEKQTQEGVGGDLLIADILLGGNTPPVQVLQIRPTVRMPRRWQPWKFISVAMVIPWLLMHATHLHQPVPNLSKQVAPPMLRKASLPPVLHFVPMHEANWPK